MVNNVENRCFFLTVWMHVCRNIPRFTVCCNMKQSEITFKIVVNLGIGTHASCTLNTITNDLGRSWGMGMYIYIYIYISSMSLFQNMMAD